MLQVILPLKNLATAKGRLAEVLGPESRRRLVVALARDTLELLSGEAIVTQVTVVAGAHWEEHIAQTSKLRFVGEEDLGVSGLNALLDGAVNQLPSPRTLVLHGDLPFLACADIQAVHQRLESEDLLLCPDEAGTGTNGLAFRAGARPAFNFGEFSFSAHRAAATALECVWGIVETAGFEFDVDSPADLMALARAVESGQRVGPRTADWVSQYRAELTESAPGSASPSTQPARIVAEPV